MAAARRRVQRAGEHKNDTQCALKLFFPGGWTGNQCALFPIQGCRQKDARDRVCVEWSVAANLCCVRDPKKYGTQNASFTQNVCFIISCKLLRQSKKLHFIHHQNP
jgi:hypothetical protein